MNANYLRRTCLAGLLTFCREGTERKEGVRSPVFIRVHWRSFAVEASCPSIRGDGKIMMSFGIAFRISKAAAREANQQSAINNQHSAISNALASEQGFRPSAPASPNHLNLLPPLASVAA
jgi:hypothetical protein